MSWPELAHPTVILHGTEDDVVPIENSRKVAAGSELVELVEIEDGHRMLKSLDHLASAVEKLGLS
jgi:dipeptidyl aminopeptidase/acylaminoacyl peptidase